MPETSVWDKKPKKSKPTFTDPGGGAFFPSPVTEKVCFPNFLSFIDHVRAKVSSVWPVSISSQSFVRVVEKDIVVIGGSLRDATGIDKLVAFFARDPAEVTIL